MDKMGVCRFCGQSQIVEMDDRIENLTPEQEEEMVNEAATRGCTCERAKRYTQIETSKEEVSLQIQALFEADHQAMGEILIDAIEPVASGKIKSITVKAGEETVITAKMVRTKDGTIRATREDKATAVAEA